MKQSLFQTVRNDVIEQINYIREAVQTPVRDVADWTTVVDLNTIYSFIRLTVFTPIIDTIEYNFN